MNRYKKFDYSLLITIILCTFCLEGIIRIFHLAPRLYHLNLGENSSPLKRSSNPNLLYEYKPLFIPKSNLSKIPQTNSRGFRDIEHEFINKNRNRKRIFFIGDSVLDGNFSESLFDKKLGIFSKDDLLPLQISKHLDFNQYEIFNFSVNGYCTKNELQLVKNNIALYGPTNVIVVFVDSNFNNCFGMLSSVPRQPSKYLEFLFEHSKLFRLLSLNFDLFDFNKNISLSDAYSKKFYNKDLKSALTKFHGLYEGASQKLLKNQSSPNDYDRAFNTFFNIDSYYEKIKVQKSIKGSESEQVQKSFLELKKLCDLNNAKLSVLIWPFFTNKTITDFNHRQGVVLDKKLEIETILDRLLIKHFRLSAILNKELKISNPQKDFTIGDGQHLNVYGSHVIAPIIAKLMTRKNL